MKVVLATGNLGKVAEMQSTLADFGFNVVAQSHFGFEEAIEDGLSFVENAIIKARHACMHTGLPAIADDSGLEVDALDGAPGIYSSRYAQLDVQSDSANNSKLLNALKGVENRSARFRCVLVYMSHANDPSPIICNGCWEGAIAHEYKGDNGFGYDPVFLVPELALHAAELEPSQKKQFSHRGQALQKLHQAFKSDKRYNIHPS